MDRGVKCTFIDHGRCTSRRGPWDLAVTAYLGHLPLPTFTLDFHPKPYLLTSRPQKPKPSSPLLQVLDWTLQEQLAPFMRDIVPLPGERQGGGAVLLGGRGQGEGVPGRAHILLHGVAWGRKGYRVHEDA